MPDNYFARYLPLLIHFLVASVLAGFLWDRYGAPATFYAGATFALAAFLLFALARTRRSERAKPSDA